MKLLNDKVPIYIKKPKKAPKVISPPDHKKLWRILFLGG
jgi:hypothetical protein